MISEKSKDVLDRIRHKDVRKHLILWNLNFVYNLPRTKCSYKSHKRINFIQHNAFEEFNGYSTNQEILRLPWNRHSRRLGTRECHGIYHQIFHRRTGIF